MDEQKTIQISETLKKFSEVRLDFGYLLLETWKLFTKNGLSIFIILTILFLPASVGPGFFAADPYIQKIIKLEPKEMEAEMNTVVQLAQRQMEGKTLTNEDNELLYTFTNLSIRFLTAIIIPTFLAALIALVAIAFVFNSTLQSIHITWYNALFAAFRSLPHVAGTAILPVSIVIVLILFGGAFGLIALGLYIFIIFAIVMSALFNETFLTVYQSIGAVIKHSFIWTVIMSFVFLVLGALTSMLIPSIIVGAIPLEATKENINLLLGIQYYLSALIGSFFFIMLPIALFLNLLHLKMNKDIREALYYIETGKEDYDEEDDDDDY